MKDDIKLLEESYDYYKSVKEKSDILALKIFKKDDEILKARLYNLILNLCNQVIYDFTYVFTKEDLFFIADYNINIYKLLNNFISDIAKIKLQMCENEKIETEKNNVESRKRRKINIGKKIKIKNSNKKIYRK